MKNIEVGFKKFHKLPQKVGPITYVLRQGCDKTQAFLWSYPSGDIITFSKDLESKVKESNYKLFDLEGDFDREYILERHKFKPFQNTNYTYEELSQSDQSRFDDFLSKCSDEDKDYGQVALDDPIVVGISEDDKIIAVASVWLLDNDLADIGLIVDPAYRNQGLGKSVASFLIEQLPAEKIPVYRTDIENPYSTKVAQALGFSLFCKIYRLKKQ